MGTWRHICVSVAGVNDICVCILGGDLAAIQEPEGLTAGAGLCLVNLVSLYFNHISLIFYFFMYFSEHLAGVVCIDKLVELWVDLDLSSKLDFFELQIHLSVRSGFKTK